MPTTQFVDFETFYDKEYHLRQKGMTYPAFIKDKRFHAFGMAVDDGKGQDWVEGKDVPKWFKAHSKDVIGVHNGFFDFAVMKWHYDFVPAYMIDTLLIANHVLGSARDQSGQRNDLRSLAERLGLEAKGRVEFMRGVRHPTEEQMVALISYAKGDVRLGRQILERLLPEFSNADFEFWLMDHSFRLYLERPLTIDTKKLAEVRGIVEKRQADILKAADVPRPVLASDKQFATYFQSVLAEHNIKVPMKRAAKPRADGTQPLIPALSKGDSAFIKLTEHKNPKVANLVKARLVVRSAATVAARLATMEAYAKMGLGIPVHLIYYGAHTGRFAGGGGFNFQNLTSPDRATEEIERLIANLVRQVITAGEGMVFVPVDAAQIEARVLAWLAGETQVLEAFASGVDLYSDFISDVLEEDIHKPTGKEPPEVKNHLTLMRNVGKVGVLGLGYQMGVDKFLVTLHTKAGKEVAAKVESGEFDKKFAGEVVEGYREKYTKIVDFWYQLERAFHAARIGGVRRLGHLTFRRVGPRAVGIELPSGRTLYYRNIRSEPYKGKANFTGVNGSEREAKNRVEWKHGAGQKIYGGLLAENITQAVSRDILAESILRSEQAGFPVSLHVHDEIVAKTEKARGEEAKEFLIKSLSTPPEWGKGMVLSAEGKVSADLGK